MIEKDLFGVVILVFKKMLDNTVFIHLFLIYQIYSNYVMAIGSIIGQLAGPATSVAGGFAQLGFGLAEQERVRRDQRRIDEEVKQKRADIKNKQVMQMYGSAVNLQNRQNIQNMIQGRANMGGQGLIGSLKSQGGGGQPLAI